MVVKTQVDTYNIYEGSWKLYKLMSNIKMHTKIHVNSMEHLVNYGNISFGLFIKYPKKVIFR